MKHEEQGHIIKINNTESRGASGFKVRTFWVETQDKYPQTLEFELSQDKCGMIDGFSVHEPVLVHFNIRGRAWEPKDGRPTRVFTTLKPWKIESLEHPEDKKERQACDAVDDNDIPF